MGSEYTVLKDEKRDVELKLCEMSNEFDLTVDAPEDVVNELDGYFDIKKRLTPEDLVEIGFKFIQTAAYWADGKEMRELIEKKLAEVFFLD
jgi:hypothetical protein